jgi:tRNA(Glu) U13 pseudouridine synthase TruD
MMKMGFIVKEKQRYNPKFKVKYVSLAVSLDMRDTIKAIQKDLGAETITDTLRIIIRKAQLNRTNR